MTPGSRIGPYEIVAPLGAGGMGEVYRARDPKLNREVAIKVLPEAFAQDADRMARFTREAQVLASLNHPNIAIVYAVEDSALVMELVPGPTLEERIGAGPIAIEEALPIARQIAEGLEAAHERGIMHRDLKPANIKITPEGVVKLLDFGLAKAAAESSPRPGSPTMSPTLSLAMTQTGMIMGTAGYMAPEQAAGKVVDKRADIWSFGVVLYEMLCGKRLFEGETVAHTLADVLRAEIDLGKLPASTAPALRKLLRRCLERNLKKRLRDIGEARILLEDLPVEEAAPVAAAPPIPLPRLPWVLAGVCAVCALVLAGLWLRRPAEEVHAVKFSVMPPGKAAFSGLPAISPDGRHLAFAATTDGKQELWVRDLDSLAARPVASVNEAPRIQTPFWSPDSRSLAFFADGKLKRIDISGGPATTLCDAENPRGGSWGRQDVIVFQPGANSGLLRVPSAGGDPVPATELDSSQRESSHRWPWFLPDGRHFLFFATNSQPGKQAIWVGDLESKTRRRVIAASSNAAYDPQHGLLLFARENTLMAQPFHIGRLETAGDPFPIAEQVDYSSSIARGDFSVSENGTLVYESGASTGSDRLTWLDRTGKLLGTVGPPGVFHQLAISPDGGTVAIDRSDPTNGLDIWLVDLAHATDSRFTVHPKADLNPIWSPDGSHILFVSDRTGQPGLYLKTAAGTSQEELLFDSPGQKRPADWSRDGKFMIYTEQGPETGQDIWVLPDPLGDKASRKPYPFLATRANESSPRLSPDGKFLAYISDESHNYEVYVQSFPDKDAKFQISNNGGAIPVWSPDGKELFYVAADHKMMAVDVKTGARFEHGLPKPLFATRNTIGRNFGISADGKRFLMIQEGDESAVTSLTVALNWFAGVRK